MSTVKAMVTKVTGIRSHPNADRLELGIIGGWQVCLPKDRYKNGDEVVYLEQGSVIPEAMAIKLGIANHLSSKTDINGIEVKVVYRVRLRGEPSFGLVIDKERDMKEGDDVTEYYGITKFMPPPKELPKDGEEEDIRFPSYTDIENMRSFSSILKEDEEVLITEKIHGRSARLGCVYDNTTMTFMAGSRTIKRKYPGDNTTNTNLYWAPMNREIVELMEGLIKEGANQVVIYGEIFGKGIQNYSYGIDEVKFRAFDLMIDGCYMDYDLSLRLFNYFNILTAPLLYRGLFNLDIVKELSNGNSLVGGNQGREGVVVKPIKERTDPSIGRVILKYVGDDYLFGKGNDEADTTDI
jgi:RNA ligase (TIGR02306 family)